MKRLPSLKGWVGHCIFEIFSLELGIGFVKITSKLMIIGHQKQWEFLLDKFNSGNLAHTYLFSGTEGLGKSFFAKEFIKFINCQGKEKPCQSCQNCLSIDKESYPDLLVIKSSNSQSSLKEGQDKMEVDVSQIRDAQNFLSYKSYYGGFKAVVVDDADRMNQEAQSCFLKTLEEPKGKTVIILVSSKPQTLLTTITSRSQEIKFFNAKLEDFKKYLKSQGIDDKKAELIIKASEGKPARLISLLNDQGILKEEDKTLNDLLKIINYDLSEKFVFAKKADLENGNLDKILITFQKYFRNLLLAKVGAGNKIEDPKNFTPEKISKIIKLIEDLKYKNLTSNINSKLALEILLMEI